MTWEKYDFWWTLRAANGPRLARLYMPDYFSGGDWVVRLMRNEFNPGETVIHLDGSLALDEAKSIAQTLLGAHT